MPANIRSQYISRPDITFGPLRFIEALPWLVLATGMRVIAFGGGPAALPAIIVASIAVMQAFLVTARRSIEIADGQTNLGSLTFSQEIRLSWSILIRTTVVMLFASFAWAWTGHASNVFNPMNGIDGMAFDDPTALGKIWNTVIATIVLLMIVGAERHRNKVRFFAACLEFARRGAWLGAGIAVLALCYFVLGFGQGLVRNAIALYWQAPTPNPLIRNLVFFVFIFSFAMLRLWVTLLVLTFALKQSYINGV